MTAALSRVHPSMSLPSVARMRLRLVRLACHCRQFSDYSKAHFYLYTKHSLATSTHITNALYCPPHQCQMQPSTMTTRRMLLQVNMLYLSLLTFTLLGLSCALSLPSPHPTLPLALPDAFNTSNITSLSRNVNDWPPVPFTYAFYGLTIDINAYFSGPTPPPPTNPILLDLISIQNQIYVSGRPNDRLPSPTTLSNGAVKLFFYAHGQRWITRRQAAQIPDALWDLTFAYGVRGIMWAGVRVGNGGVAVNFVMEIAEPEVES